MEWRKFLRSIPRRRSCRSAGSDGGGGRVRIRSCTFYSWAHPYPIASWVLPAQPHKQLSANRRKHASQLGQRCIGWAHSPAAAGSECGGHTPPPCEAGGSTWRGRETSDAAADIDLLRRPNRHTGGHGTGSFKLHPSVMPCPQKWRSSPCGRAACVFGMSHALHARTPAALTFGMNDEKKQKNL